MVKTFKTMLKKILFQPKLRPPRQPSINSTTSLLTNSSGDTECVDYGGEFQRTKGREITRRRGAVKHQRFFKDFQKYLHNNTHNMMTRTFSNRLINSIFGKRLYVLIIWVFSLVIVYCSLRNNNC